MITRTDIQLDAVVIPRGMLNIQTKREEEALLFFIKLLLLANTEDTEWAGLIIPRGSLLTSYRDLAEQFGMTVQKVRTLVQRNTNQHTINTRSTHQLTHITICDYDRYIVCQHSNQHTTNTQLTQQSTHFAPAQDINILNYNNNIFNTQEESDKSKAEEDVKKKEKHTLLSHASHDDLSVSFSDAADRLYSMYPASVKRSDGTRRTLRCGNDKNKIIRLLKNGHTEEELAEKIKSYMDENPGEYTRMLSTFLNNLPDYSEPEETKPKEDDWKQEKKLFWKKDFEEHPDEFKAMDFELRRIINRELPLKWENGKWIKG